MEQRVQGTLQIWAEPFVPLRVPKLFNLRTDPFERADITSNTYWDWLIDSAYIVLAATDARRRSSSRRSRSSRRARRRPRSRIDQVVEKLESALAGRQLIDAPPAADDGLGAGGDVRDGLGRPLPRGGAGPPGGGRRVLDRPPPGDEPATSPRSSPTTGYVTVAERPLDPADFPGAPPENLVPGSLVFTRTPGPVDLRHLEPVVDVDARRVAGGTRRARVARSTAARTTRSSTSPTRTPRRTRRGPARRCRPRPSGSSPPAAGSTARRSPGATSRSRRAGGWPTTGTATSRGAPTPGYGDDRAGRVVPAQRLRAPRHGRQRVGVDGGLVRRPPPRRRRRAVLRPARPARRRASASSLDPAQPQFRDPAQGDQGRLVPVRRQLLPALPARRAPAADDRHRHEPHRRCAA